MLTINKPSPLSNKLLIGSLLLCAALFSACSTLESTPDATPGSWQSGQQRLHQQFAAQVKAAISANEPAKVFSSSQAITVSQAYKVQTLAVSALLQDQRPLGFKAGLTSTGAQQKFAVGHPVAGVLHSGGQPIRAGKVMVDSKAFNNMMLEAELGFIANQTITTPVATIAELQTLFTELVPVIELPDLAFDKPAVIKAVDIIANNVAAKQFAYGAVVPVGSVDINKLTVSIKQSGRVLASGQGSDAMGDQWQALLWLVNRSVESGWAIQPGQLLITGALGKMIPGGVGRYEFDFTELGVMTLLVQ